MPELGEVRHGWEIGYKQRYSHHIWSACVDCGRERWIHFVLNQPCYTRCPSCAHKGYHPCKKTRVKLSKARKDRYKGSNSPCWRGGRHFNRKGYVLIYLYPDDFFYPMADKGGYILEHRLIVARKLNRCLLSWEIVHHKNQIKADNRIENLQLLSLKQHLPSMKFQGELTKRDKRIEQLEQRVTLLEAEKILLSQQIKGEVTNENTYFK